MYERENQILQTDGQNVLLYDVYLPKDPVACVFFMHGFKGFKDWGHFKLVAKSFADEGIAFVKFNFSHNGIGVDNITNFSRLDKFAENTLTKELHDLKCVENELMSKYDFLSDLPVFYMGHSRGAGIGIIAASENENERHAISWAGVSDYESWFKKFDLESWKSKGSIEIPNARTGQMMPMNYAIIEDLQQNFNRLSIENACKKLQTALLICQGTDDEAIDISEARAMYDWTKNAELIIVQGAQHTFNVSHPFDGELPPEAKLVIEQSIAFVKTIRTDG